MSESEVLLDDRYTIVHIQRNTSFRKVFLALDTYQTPPRSCLIEVFEPIIQTARISHWIESEFNRELKKLKDLSLRNRHLPEIYTYSSEFQAYYIIRELVEGEVLSKLVRDKGVFAPLVVREIMLNLLSVLDYLHQENVVHQNIQPKNIILRREDQLPMPIDFGRVEQIISTYGFYRDKQVFSNSNNYGYLAPEQASGQAVPASDLYSLGMTALYLLTAKHPSDYRIKDSTDFKLPQAIWEEDAELAATINRAINPNLSDRYQSALEMSEDLSEKKQGRAKSNQIEMENEAGLVIFDTSSDLTQTTPPIKQKKHLRQWAIFLISGICIIGAGLLAFYDWRASRSTVRSLPEPAVEPSGDSPRPTAPQVRPPSILNSPADSVVQIPIFSTGTTKQEISQAIGRPNEIKKGLWSNSSAWIYNKADDEIDLGYLFDLDTEKVRQTEVAIAPAVGLATIKDILASLLQGKTTPAIDSKLEQIYRRQIDKYSFTLGNLAGSIEREPDDNIYLGVWERDFH